MIRRLKTPLIIAGIVIYLLLAVLVSVFYQFPYNQTAARFLETIDRSLPVGVSIGRIEPGFPFNLQVRSGQISLRAPGGVQPVFEFKGAAVNLDRLPLLLGRLGCTFSLPSASGGAVSGRAFFRPLSGQLGLDCRSISLPGFAFSLPNGQGGIRGDLTGNADFYGSADGFPATGSGDLEFGPGRLEGLQISGMPLNALDFDRLRIVFQIKDGNAAVQTMELDGQQAGLTMTGTIRNLRDPMLNLRGAVRLGPKGSPAPELKLTLTGRLDNPKVITTR